MTCETSICGGDGQKFYVGDVGTEIILDTCSDITTATKASILVMKPNATSEIEWVGAVYETTKIKYVTQVGDLDPAGEYRAQAYVEMPGWTGRGNTVTFKVSDPFE